MIEPSQENKPDSEEKQANTAPEKLSKVDQLRQYNENFVAHVSEVASKGSQFLSETIDRLSQDPAKKEVVLNAIHASVQKRLGDDAATNLQTILKAPNKGFEDIENTIDAAQDLSSFLTENLKNPQNLGLLLDLVEVVLEQSPEAENQVKELISQGLDTVLNFGDIAEGNTKVNAKVYQPGLLDKVRTAAYDWVKNEHLMPFMQKQFDVSESSHPKLFSENGIMDHIAREVVAKNPAFNIANIRVLFTVLSSNVLDVSRAG